MSNHKRPRVTVVGHSEAIVRVAHDAMIAARGDAHILITGEPGVGKSVVARFIHENSDRSPLRFAMIKCQGVPDALFESELFGHAQGSIAGAYSDKPGLLESAAGGTVFIEEVSALSVGMQTRLVQFLKTSDYVRMGSDRIEFRHHVRLIASTSANLKARVAAGLFLDELYERLSGVRLTVPPLRERRDDIPLLVDHFAAEFGGARGADIPVAVREMLYRAEYPGNVQELKSIVLRQLLASTGGNRVPPLPPSA